jgi:fumarate reductase (CoM/CoB) subunit B
MEKRDNMRYADEVKEKCIHCKQCTRHCKFLEKYSMNLASFASREDFAYHCFLCGKCKEVCPINLDGAELAHEMRRANPKGFSMMKFLKTPYKFANNSKIKSTELLFLGCNFPTYYPETSKQLISLLKRYKIDFSIDCCGKPIYESGDIKCSQKSFDHIKNLLKIKKVERLICVCPNCYHFLKERLDIEVITIYEKLYKLDIGNSIEETAHVFHPCPDKESLEVFNTIEPYLRKYESSFEDVNCCGFGGLAIKQEGKLAQEFVECIKQKKIDNIYTYCASCSASISRSKTQNVRHVLSEILGVQEEVNQSYAKNVAQLMRYQKSRK